MMAWNHSLLLPTSPRRLSWQEAPAAEDTLPSLATLQLPHEIVSRPQAATQRPPRPYSSTWRRVKAIRDYFPSHLELLVPSNICFAASNVNDRRCQVVSILIINIIG